MANWLEQMFTPQRPGPGQMAWRDKDVGEGSGEISQGDIQEMYWKRNPAKTGNRGQQMTSAVEPNPDGMGVDPLSQIGRDMGKLAGGNESAGILDGISEMGPGMDGGGMGEISIAEVISGNRSGMGDQDPGIFTGNQGQGGVSMDAMYPPGDPMGSGIGGSRAANQTFSTDEEAVPAGRRYMYPTLPGRNPDAILGSPYQSGMQSQANLIGSNPDRAGMKLAAIRQQRALREAEAAKMASYTNQAPEHRSLEPFGGAGETPETYGGALNVADMVGQFSRSSLPSHKQPPGFWDWISGGKFN